MKKRTMKKRTIALAIVTAWVCTLTGVAPVGAAKLPIAPVQPPSGSGGHESDPWVPDGERPTKAFAGVKNASVDEARVASKDARPEVTGWFVRLLRALRWVAVGGGR
jgi:hypothetical protein